MTDRLPLILLSVHLERLPSAKVNTLKFCDFLFGDFALILPHLADIFSKLLNLERKTEFYQNNLRFCFLENTHLMVFFSEFLFSGRALLSTLRKSDVFALILECMYACKKKQVR